MSEKLLFPDRGVKVELGKVYQPLAFGSTAPRNMMPSHLTSVADDTTHRNLTRRAAQEKKLTALRLKALSKHEEVFKLQKQFKARSDKFFSSKRLKNFKHTVTKLHKEEDPLRPPDKTGFLRPYSSLDKATWTMTEMRDWYNKGEAGGAPNTPSSAGSASGTPMQPWQWAGARDTKLRDNSLPRVHSSPRLPSTGSFSSHSSRLGYSSGSSAPSSSRSGQSGRSRPDVRTAFAAGTLPGVYRSHPHWMDFESCLGEVRAQEASRSGPYELRKPWKDRPVEESAAPPPVETLLKREAELFRAAATASVADRAVREQLKQRMQKGEWHS